MRRQQIEFQLTQQIKILKHILNIREIKLNFIDLS